MMGAFHAYLLLAGVLFGAFSFIPSFAQGNKQVEKLAGENLEIVEAGKHTFNIDFAGIAPGLARERRINLVNKLKYPLAIRRIDTDCSCLSIRTMGEEVKPDGTLSFEITYRSDGPLRGPFRQIGRIGMTGPEGQQHEVVIEIAGEVTEESRIISLTRTVQLGVLAAEGVVIQPVTVMVTSDLKRKLPRRIVLRNGEAKRIAIPVREGSTTQQEARRYAREPVTIEVLCTITGDDIHKAGAA